jgi:hypothetical protein
MFRNSHRHGPFVAAMLIIILSLTVSTAAPQTQAQGNLGNPGILPPNSHPFGHTYGEWSAKWWQFVFSIPAPDNPLLNDDKCTVGQSGKVWFLTGKFCVGTGCPPVLNVVRTCRIPSGTALFFPIANSEVDNLGVDPPLSLEELREFARQFQDGVQSMSAEIDGRPVNGLSPAISSPYRVVSPVFDYTIPENNIYQAIGLPFGAQTVQDAVADGAFLMLAPLSVGQHTIRFTASFGGGFGFDVTYFINVVPRGQY